MLIVVYMVYIYYTFLCTIYVTVTKGARPLNDLYTLSNVVHLYFLQNLYI